MLKMLIATVKKIIRLVDQKPGMSETLLEGKNRYTKLSKKGKAHRH